VSSYATVTERERESERQHRHGVNTAYRVNISDHRALSIPTMLLNLQDALVLADGA
jgi:hypothetical protein